MRKIGSSTVTGTLWDPRHSREVRTYDTCKDQDKGRTWDEVESFGKVTYGRP